MRTIVEHVINAAGDRLFLLRDGLEKRRQAAGEARRAQRAALAQAAQAWLASLRRWQTFRQALNRGGGLAAVLACLLLAMVLFAHSINVWGMLAHDAPASRAAATGYYYDLASGELFVAAADQFPPIAAPSGQIAAEGTPSGVRAFVFTCGQCDEASRFVGYLETLTPEAYLFLQRAVAGGEGGSPEMFDQLVEGYRIASPDLASGWLTRDSAEGKRLFSDLEGRCGRDRQPHPCLPDSP